MIPLSANSIACFIFTQSGFDSTGVSSFRVVVDFGDKFSGDHFVCFHGGGSARAMIFRSSFDIGGLFCGKLFEGSVLSPEDGLFWGLDLCSIPLWLTSIHGSQFQSFSTLSIGRISTLFWGLSVFQALRQFANYHRCHILLHQLR